MLQPRLKERTCRGCKERFMQIRLGQAVCTPKCAMDVARFKREKAEMQKRLDERKEDKAKREKLKTRSDWIKEAQKAVNAWIRRRDAGQPCISCKRRTGSKENAGHFLSTGARPELRFEPLNIHLQCEHCNTYLSGNLLLYRRNLIKKIGLEKVEWLEGPHELPKWTIEELREIRDNYRRKAKEIEK